MTIRPLYPPIEPSLNLDFANTKRLDPRITFTRASTGSFIGADGLIKTAAVNEARFDHSPTTGESLGLLVEEQRSNLAVQSENFGTTWTTLGLLAFGSGSTLNAIAAPNGQITADLLTEDSANSEHRVNGAAISWAGNTSYTFTLHVKSAGCTRFDFLFGTGGNWSGGRQVVFDLSNGTIHSTDGATGSITALPNGWYRCRITALTVASPSASSIFLRFLDNNNSSLYTGDGTSGLYLWGAQLEVGSFPTSYIPTGASAVTRAADVCSITGSNFSSWYRQDEGTVFVDTASIYNGGRYFMFDNGTGNERWDGRYNSFLATANSWSNNIQDVALNTGITGDTPSTNVRLAIANASNNVAIASNGAGATVGTDASSTMPSGQSRLFIGSFQGTATFTNGPIRRITYWPTRLSNSTLQTLTL